MSGENKSTFVETDSRISLVYRLLLNGLRRREIIQYISEKTDWEVTDRTIDTYIQKARAEISEITEIERDGAYGMARKRLDDLYYKSMKINDYKTCLAVQKEISELEGLKVSKSEISGDGGGPVVLAVLKGVKLEEL